MTIYCNIYIYIIIYIYIYIYIYMLYESKEIAKETFPWASM